MGITPRIFDLIFDELGKQLGGSNKLPPEMVPYQLFLDNIYVTHMFTHELDLYQALVAADVDGNNGVTITEVQEILSKDPKFNFPPEALGAAFKALLGADIKDIDPNCIIDTEKFIASLHKEFEGITVRSISKITQ